MVNEMPQDEINIFTTRSFWLMVASAIITILKVYQIDIGIDENMLVEIAMTLLPVLLSLWAYGERYFGKKKLVFHRVEP